MSGAGRALFLSLLVGIVCCLQGVDSGRLSSRSIEDDLKSQLGTLQGSTCLTDQGCSAYISFCHKGNVLLPGECRLVWWFILALVLLGLTVVFAVVSCLFCPCCCLFALGKKLCCCPGRG